MGTIKDYRNMVDQPWGRMFYEMIFKQLIITNDKRIRILDFGAGFCITANHYAKNHDVVAVEPNEEMYSLRVEENEYTLITQGLDYLKTVPDNSIDFVICHNVLEYVENKEEILKQLVRVLKQEGTLSIIKHNLFGRVMGSAVLGDNPHAALDLLNNVAEDSMFGNRDVYGNEFLTDLLSGEMALSETYGIRAFFGLSSNNEIKYTDDWYKSMLELEAKASTMDEFRKIAFFNHLIFKKKS
ncbi:class I SAM-dependent methyltransferase [Butyrivibrio sp. MC2013]|uniref:class I SAM-dependent methyltransferase n=1 Tax=Butyrivibrio sp. MC2013 TaxID=1280686 RepID=UPI00047BD04C|nr:class I SAM-dependent methyltransferase [Butyrivibrio sp. MC2013]